MDLENPTAISAPIPEANEGVSVVTSASADISNDTVLNETATTPMESKKESKKGKAVLKKTKISLKESKKTENKRKTSHPPTSEMAIAAIKELKKRNGASLADIHDYIEHHYAIDMKRIRHHLKKFLVTGVEKGILEQLSGTGAVDRFKIKVKQVAKTGNAKEGKQAAKRGAAKEEKQVAKQEKQTAKKGTVKKEKPTAEKGAAKKKIGQQLKRE